MKRRKRGFNSNYPEKRKKKRSHAQFFRFYRVIDKWKIVPEIHYMFKIDGEFWACKPDSLFNDNLIVGGSTYKPVHSLVDYDGQEGDMVYGYVAIINSANMGVTLSRFVLMKDPVMEMSLDLSYFVGIKSKIHKEKYIKYYLWE